MTEQDSKPENSQLMNSGVDLESANACEFLEAAKAGTETSVYLQDALIEGEQSGEPQPFDFDAFKARKRAEFKGKD
ncbi:hypothetical protein J2045_003928 [Peteryoungia aggregata LMG 23059]|uniref:Uncharacterized protein n=1 Tax=Peteryoungia aggregata LMG 23059 TaxID=1368425 RepID=A0ABU0GC58_9HYPH|nr:type II toxin-antitoxin system ParD family antitoxin [Peteryoungia aggregata]MDQ0422878.1 hypothetical protein [Peteryoungia aggregata LMG 23059]